MYMSIAIHCFAAESNINLMTIILQIVHLSHPAKLADTTFL